MFIEAAVEVLAHQNTTDCADGPQASQNLFLLCTARDWSCESRMWAGQIKKPVNPGTCQRPGHKYAALERSTLLASVTWTFAETYARNAAGQWVVGWGPRSNCLDKKCWCSLWRKRLMRIVVKSVEQRNKVSNIVPSVSQKKDSVRAWCVCSSGGTLERPCRCCLCAGWSEARRCVAIISQSHS